MAVNVFLLTHSGPKGLWRSAFGFLFCFRKCTAGQNKVVTKFRSGLWFCFSLFMSMLPLYYKESSQPVPGYSCLLRVGCVHHQLWWPMWDLQERSGLLHSCIAAWRRFTDSGSSWSLHEVFTKYSQDSSLRLWRGSSVVYPPVSYLGYFPIVLLPLSQPCFCHSPQ